MKSDDDCPNESFGNIARNAVNVLAPGRRRIAQGLKGNRHPRRLSVVMDELSRPTVFGSDGTILAREYIVRNVMLVPEDLYTWVEKNHRKAERFKGWRIAACYAVEELAGTNEMYFIPEVGEMVRIQFEDKAFDMENMDGIQEQGSGTVPQEPVNGLDHKAIAIPEDSHNKGQVANDEQRTGNIAPVTPQEFN